PTTARLSANHPHAANGSAHAGANNRPRPRRTSRDGHESEVVRAAVAQADTKNSQPGITRSASTSPASSPGKTANAVARYATRPESKVGYNQAGLRNRVDTTA